MNAAIPLQHPAPAAVDDQVRLVRKQSNLGIASFLIALGLPLLVLALLAILFVLQGRIENEAFTDSIVIIGASIAGFIGHLVGLTLGVAGALQKQRKRLLAVLGIVFNSVPMLLAATVCILFVAFLIHPFPLGPK